MKRQEHHSPAAAGTTEIILEIFRVNGLLLAAGDRLTADLGLSSARWQVMGAIVDGPLPVAAIGRRMGLTRQAVQRVADDLVQSGHCAFASNPDHKRAKLLGFTAKGDAAYAAISARQVAWSNALARGLSRRRLAAVLAVLGVLRGRLERSNA